MTRILLLAVTLFFPYQLAQSSDLKVGQKIQLSTPKPSGVPLHKHSHSSMFGRAVNNTNATIIEIKNNWLKIKLDDNREAWIVKKYIAKTTPSSKPASSSSSSTTPAVTNTNNEGQVWRSKAQCLAIVNAGHRMNKALDQFRIGSYNIRWFNDGTMAPTPSNTKQTDIEWLACVIAFMNVDILSLQEIRTHNKAQQAMKDLLSKLKKHTKVTWKFDLQNCGHGALHHVGFIWRTDRTSIMDTQDLWRFNAKARNSSKPCASNRRPGAYGYVKTSKGLDFHLISVHLKSAPKPAAQLSRKTSIERIDKSVKRFLGKDKDIIIIGDFNSMGNKKDISMPQEIELMRQAVKLENPGFKMLSPQCSEYYQKKPGTLDHVLISNPMVEGQSALAKISGYCKQALCQKISGPMPKAYNNLSDHCPVIIDINNRDLD